MSVNILDTAFPPHRRPQDWGQATEDLDSTTDLHEENTRDLEPDAPVDPESDLAVSESAAPEQSSVEPQLSVEPGIADTPVVSTQPRRPRAPPLAPGAVLSDRYLLEQVIGSGGTAVVYCARDMHSSAGAAPNSQVAIKTPRPELSHRARATARLKHEFKHAHLLSHPNIVRVFDLGQDGPHCFMTMELIEGKLLSVMLRESAPLPGPLALKILQGCAQALRHAHSHNVAHGDFKPSNIFVTPDESVKIVDFGASAAPSDEDSRIPAGTPAYASPQVLNAETPEQRDDVFSFACVAYELLTGEHPFERRSSLEASNEGWVPPRAWSLSASQWLALLSALSWEREQRPKDLDALLIALTPEPQSLSESASAALQPSTFQPPTLQRVAEELPEDLMPPQRSWGFIVFVACALIVTFIASQRQSDPDAIEASGANSDLPAASAAAGAASAETSGGTDNAGARPAQSPAASETGNSPDAGASVPVVEPDATTSSAAAKPTPVALSQISFEAASIVTSESSVAAVFLIKRSAPLSGRMRVQWRAVSGTAKAGSDFAADAGGTVELADGQAQRAIYVPLLNDLLKEEDETFTVELRAPQQARLGAISRAEATILDDD